MSDNDPFADLGETLEDQDRDQVPADSAQETGAADSTDDESKSTASPTEQTPQRDPVTDTAFSYEAAQQRPFYARTTTIDDFDSWLNYELERELSTRGYQNIVVREMTDALLRAVVEEDLIDEVAERFEQARKSAIDE
ncbi:hypothetical protein [Halalkalicoccus salilacus]|uniref:hypothetical protein n=1 Tax=Halalkalicoccus TaxID=332246 RepID=UPI002F969639